MAKVFQAFALRGGSTSFRLGLLGLIAIGGYAIAACLPHSVLAPKPDYARFIVAHALIQPKRLAGIIYVYLIVAAVVAAGLQALRQRRQPQAGLDIAPLTLAIGAAVVLVFVALLPGGLTAWAAVLALPVFLGLRLLLRERSRPVGRADWLSPRNVLGLLLLLALVFSLLTKPFGAADLRYAVDSAHYEPVIYSIVMSASGATCLADFVPQYGCYGEFLRPLVLLFGAQTWALTGMLTVLQVLALFAVLSFTASLLGKVGRAREQGLVLLAVGGVYLHDLLFNVISSFDPYFQYTPIRLVMPAIALLWMRWIIGLPSHRRVAAYATALGTGAFSAAALLWNLDTGVAVFFALWATQVMAGFTGWRAQQAPRLVREKAAVNALYLGAFAAGVYAVKLLLQARSGVHIDLVRYFAFVLDFAKLGFANLPAPGAFSYWGCAAAVIFAVVMVSASKLACADRRRDTTLEMALGLAMLSALLLVYYTGRSHELVFKLASWPVAALAGVLLLYALAEVDRGWLRNGTLALITAMLSLSLAALPGQLRGLRANSWAFGVKAPVQDSLSPETRFIEKYAKPGSVIEIFALHQAILYGQTRTWPATGGVSVTEMYLRSALQQKMRRILVCGPRKLFLGTDLGDSPGIIPRIHPDMSQLEAFYQRVARSPDGRLEYWTRKGPVLWRDPATRWRDCNLALGLR